MTGDHPGFRRGCSSRQQPPPPPPAGHLHAAGALCSLTRPYAACARQGGLYRRRRHRRRGCPRRKPLPPPPAAFAITPPRSTEHDRIHGEAEFISVEDGEIFGQLGVLTLAKS
uniref:Uncharacterized protein n=1 Tax=Oryza sativa subsp. japonica TaxID=39947 RepID=Q69QS6_ORYSJ|nr:hypothetical protein [Oryza sativa Japonica Group]BAD46333.1 hypothetical protein [Oryza sativa Japonica Group]